MENTQPVNNVNISLSEYNVIKANADAARDLLAKATTELNILRQKQTDNKLIVIEKRVNDGYNTPKTVQKLELDIKDPEVSKVILDAMSQVDNSELTKKIETLEEKLKVLKSDYEENQLALEIQYREYRSNQRKSSDEHKEEIRRLKKGYEDALLDLEIDKETLQKALKDLKVNKTQEQLELAREEEIAQLTDKLNALEQFKDQVYEKQSKPWKLVSFLKLFRDARHFREERSWIHNIWSNSITAAERVEAFTRLIKNVGKTEDKKEVKGCCKQPATPAYWNGYSYEVPATTRW